jgi:hypothetical protein
MVKYVEQFVAIKDLISASSAGKKSSQYCGFRAKSLAIYEYLVSFQNSLMNDNGGTNQ